MTFARDCQVACCNKLIATGAMFLPEHDGEQCVKLTTIHQQTFMSAKNKNIGELHVSKK